eukprot:TRINITY_DN4154_c0_g1_i2.p2 TRINITY_DN4154_c0_g1~~TRINITY_DN4154_c0_g1_i2.p2  ORF type:complete len:102 (-),score=16.55 TRINITY_DN4154_c0_g1_i2:263-568(-)
MCIRDRYQRRVHGVLPINVVLPMLNKVQVPRISDAVASTLERRILEGSLIKKKRKGLNNDKRVKEEEKIKKTKKLRNERKNQTKRRYAKALNKKIKVVNQI